MPNVIVKFYENFRFEDVDTSGVFSGSFSNGSESKLAHVQEVINQAFHNPNNPPEEPPCLTEFVEEKLYDETRTCQYSSNTLKVIASGGTWKLKVHLAAEDIETGPIAYNANAAAIAAAIGGLYADPAALEIFRITELAGEGCGPGLLLEIAPETWIRVIDIGPSEWEFRYFEAAGTHLPSGLSFLATDIDLGEVIVSKPFYDEVQYTVELEEGCSGIAAPKGKTEPGGVRAGTHRKRVPVLGRHA